MGIKLLITECQDCGHEDVKDEDAATRYRQGKFSYRIKCNNCGSRNVNRTVEEQFDWYRELNEPKQYHINNDGVHFPGDMWT